MVLRPTGVEPPFEVVRVTADGSEGEVFTAAGDDFVDQVPMPEPIGTQSTRSSLSTMSSARSISVNATARTRRRSDAARP